MKRLLSIPSLCLLAALGCGKKEEAASPPLPMPSQKEEFHKLSPKEQERYLKIKAEFDARVAEVAKEAKSPKTQALEKIFNDEVRAADRKEMMRPVPPGFKPEPVPRKAKLTLILKKTVIKPGEKVWYRAELQNLGLKVISFGQSYSFWKVGNAEFDKYHFHVTPPGGKEDYELIDVYLGGPHFPGARSRMKSEAQLRDHALRMERYSGLHVDISPGETLVSKPWRRLTEKEIYNMHYKDIEPAPVLGEYRELGFQSFRFDKPGTYRLRLIYKDYIPQPPDEEDVQRWMRVIGDDRKEATRRALKSYKADLEDSLGWVESNTVTIEVRP